MTTQYTHKGITITIDTSKDSLLSEAGVSIMQDRYFLKEYNQTTETWDNLESSPQECFARSACEYASNPQHAQRLYDYISNNWFMPATPILSNAGTKRGLPISCFLGQVEDKIEGILGHHYETGFLASYGGGAGADWSTLRSQGARTSRGNVSTGVIPFINMMDKEMLALMQGVTRRGAYAAYLDISHPEIEEFIDIRDPHGSDLNRRCLGTGFHHAVNIPNAFMEAVEKGEKWNLVDPHTKSVEGTVDARTLWVKLLTKRLETGEPYLHFVDTSNDALPKFLKDKGLRINNSNLCNEIMLPTAPDRTAVCCLSSVNLEHFDEWKMQDLFIKDILEFLDNVLQYFIDNAPKQMYRAVHSATQERSVGLGVMGFHLALQKNNIPFESPMAAGYNRKVFKFIKERCDVANLELGQERGEAPDAVGTGQRFSHTNALAPNANIAPICGNTSPSIEPYNANAFKLNSLSGTFLIKNKQLDKVLQEKYGFNGAKLEEIWSSIIVNKGSVQHLDFMEVLDKEVFKTAMELDQMWVVEHASVRQPYIDQGQSVNVFLPANVHKNVLHAVHFSAWKKGLKGLYYCRSNPIKQTETVSINTSSQPTSDVDEKPMEVKVTNHANHNREDLRSVPQQERSDDVFTVDEAAMGCLSCSG